MKSTFITLVLFFITLSAQAFEGTFQSQKYPNQSHTFKNDMSVIFNQVGSSSDGRTGNYTLVGGNLSWTIYWASGEHTRWTGLISDNSINVQYTNSWDGSAGTDVLKKVGDDGGVDITVILSVLLSGQRPLILELTDPESAVKMIYANDGPQFILWEETNNVAPISVFLGGTWQTFDVSVTDNIENGYTFIDNILRDLGNHIPVFRPILERWRNEVKHFWDDHHLMMYENVTCNSDSSASLQKTESMVGGYCIDSITEWLESEYGKCGNGKLDPVEVCDDGNLVNNDGCSSDCQEGISVLGSWGWSTWLGDGGKMIFNSTGVLTCTWCTTDGVWLVSDGIVQIRGAGETYSGRPESSRSMALTGPKITIYLSR